LKSHYCFALARRSVPLFSAFLAIAAVAVSPLATAASVKYTNPSCTSFVVSGTPPTQTVTCAGSPQLGTVTYSGSGCTSFAMTGVPPNQTLTCVSGGGVPVCTPTANPSAPANGQSMTISANCSNQPFPNGYIWTGGSCAGRTTSTCTVSKGKTGTIIFSVKATNGAGAGVPGQLSVTWH
jgi:hypothetical protein